MNNSTMKFEGKDIPVVFHSVITGRLATELTNLSAKLPSNEVLSDLLELQADFPELPIEQLIVSKNAQPFVKKHGMKKIIAVAQASQAGQVYMDTNDLKVSNEVLGMMYSKIIDVDKTIKAKNNLTTKKKESLKKYIESDSEMWLDQNIENMKRDVKNFCSRIELYIR